MSRSAAFSNVGVGLNGTDSAGFAVDFYNEAMSPSKAAKAFSDKLTFYEKKEIESYPEVYYVGQNCRNKVKAPMSGPNDGYDTENGEYVIAEGDHIAYRYETVCHLGSGAFGQVVKAYDHKTGNYVAVKLIRNKVKVAQQAKTEVEILEHIRAKDPYGRYNIVEMISSFTFRSHICLVYELLGTNLYDHMEKTDFYPMSLGSVRKVAARMLVALTFMWKENIIHCDLKPENILYKTDATSDVIKVADLGSACYDSRCAYTYIQSRFYRAPEVILGLPYGRPIDLWSFGCILCELATGYPLFPGENEKDQLACIMEYLGPPPRKMIDKCKRKRTFFDGNLEPKILPNSKGRVRVPSSKSLPTFLGLDENDPFISFLNMFLCWDPEERVTPRQAMRHPWVEEEFVFKVPKSAIEPEPSPPPSHPKTAAAANDHTDREERPPRPGAAHPRTYTHYGTAKEDALGMSGSLSSPKRSRPAMLTFDVKNGDSARDGQLEGSMEHGELATSGRSMIAADHHTVNVSIPPEVRQARLHSIQARSVGKGNMGGVTTHDTVSRPPANTMMRADTLAHHRPSLGNQAVNVAMTFRNVGTTTMGPVGERRENGAAANPVPSNTRGAEAANPRTSRSAPGTTAGWGTSATARPSAEFPANTRNSAVPRIGGLPEERNVASLVSRFSGNYGGSNGNGALPACAPKPLSGFSAQQPHLQPRVERAKTATVADQAATRMTSYDPSTRRRASEVFPPLSNRGIGGTASPSNSQPSSIPNTTRDFHHAETHARSTSPSSSSTRRQEFAMQRHARRTRQTDMALVPEPSGGTMKTCLPPL